MKSAQSRRRGSIVVAIPARDEEERIDSCIRSLYRQTVPPDHIVLLLNNCTDGTAAAARAASARDAGPRGFGPRPTLRIIERTLPPQHAHAGHARRLAMQVGARLAGASGVLLATDADSRAEPDWIAANLAALNDGADAVAGLIALDPLDCGAIPPTLHEADAKECAFDDLCDEIQALIDPDLADPWPRHTHQSGASIAVTVEAYRRAGGSPDVAAGEDRAFFAALRRIDARIRHAADCRVLVSGRTDGRAVGGMADTIRRRLAAPDLHLDDRLEPADACARRATARAKLRQVWTMRDGLADLARNTGLTEPMLRRIVAARTFGMALSRLEANSPVLRRQLVPVADVDRQIARARAIRDAVRERAWDAA